MQVPIPPEYLHLLYIYSPLKALLLIFLTFHSHFQNFLYVGLLIPLQSCFHFYLSQNLAVLVLHPFFCLDRLYLENFFALVFLFFFQADLVQLKFFFHLLCKTILHLFKTLEHCKYLRYYKIILY